MSRLRTALRASLRSLGINPDKTQPRRKSTHLTATYEARRTRELREARLRFEAGEAGRVA